MTKLVVDWPMAYSHLEIGDCTFALAPLYLKNKEYRDILKSLSEKGREIMLDNGAWEFGETIDPKEYIKVINDLKPKYCVIPDVMKNRVRTNEVVDQFFNRYDKIKLKPKLIIAPQGGTIKELRKSFNELVKKYASMIDIIGVPKHVGNIINRVKFTEHLWNQSDIKFTDVHFLGFQGWDELILGAERRDKLPWRLVSIDTKHPVKTALGGKFKSELDYYETVRPLGQNTINTQVVLFQKMLKRCLWI